MVVITRPNSSSTKTLPAGAKVISVQLTDVSALVAAFTEHNIEVVVSTVAYAAIEVSRVICSVPLSDAVVQSQHLLGDAAKQAGVKLFLPSEFGFSTIGVEAGELGIKSKFGTYLEKIGLPYLRIFVSCPFSIRRAILTCAYRRLVGSTHTSPG